jgi:hypothetical protein
MSASMADDRDRDRKPPEPEDDEPAPRGRFSRLGEQLTGLLDPESAFRRGTDLVTGVTQATKDEVIRIVGNEVRNFLDKMDAAELMQQVIAGLVVDVTMQVRFSLDPKSGRTQPEITKQKTRLRTSDAGRDAPHESADDDDDREG